MPKAGKPDVVVRPATPEQRSLLRRIQQASWGFFIPPGFDRQEVLIARLGDQPVGSTYPSDRQAWCFYRACGGELLREVRGFRHKNRPRPLVVPELPDCE
ncbi:MAG TPA: hypothetical protein EYP49_11950 [Anaerolineae bacterium]|nr:hypothetical protein [Anaerolineae bacterium]